MNLYFPVPFQGINTTSVGNKYHSFNVGKFAQTSTSSDTADEQLAIDFSEISEVNYIDTADVL